MLDSVISRNLRLREVRFSPFRISGGSMLIVPKSLRELFSQSIDVSLFHTCWIMQGIPPLHLSHLITIILSVSLFIESYLDHTSLLWYTELYLIASFHLWTIALYLSLYLKKRLIHRLPSLSNPHHLFTLKQRASPLISSFLRAYLASSYVFFLYAALSLFKNISKKLRNFLYILKTTSLKVFY